MRTRRDLSGGRYVVGPGLLPGLAACHFYAEYFDFAVISFSANLSSIQHATLASRILSTVVHWERLLSRRRALLAALPPPR